MVMADRSRFAARSAEKSGRRLMIEVAGQGVAESTGGRVPNP
jgi:hypothetical protein